MADIVYKFLAANYALQAIETNELKVATVDSLNDIFDSAPEAASDLDDPQFHSVETVKGVIAHLRDRYGLVCFSTDWKSPLLWGHYASSATGIALEFYSPRVLNQRHRFVVGYDDKRAVLKVTVHRMG